MNNKKYDELRQKAEEILSQKGKIDSTVFANDIEKLVEELNIFHIELEMQNQELQETNTKLSIEQKRYKDLYMNAPVAYITLNHTGNIIELNQAASELLQLPIQKFKYTSIFPYLAQHSKPKFVKQFKTFFDSTKIEYGEVIFLSPNNKYIYTQLNAISYFDTELNEKLVRCAISNITQVKDLKKELEIQEKLTNTEKQFRILFNNANDAIFYQEYETGRIISVNETAKKMYGYSDEEFAGMEIKQIDNNHNISQIIERVNELKTKGSINFESTHITKSGEIIPVDIKSKIIDKTTYISVARDITEQKQAQKKLKEEHEQLLSLLNTIPEPIYVADLETHEILFANNKQEEIYGENLLGEKCHKAMFNNNEICNFCLDYTNLKNNKEPIRWEYYDKINDRNFIKIIKLITWKNNKNARFQISFDITKQKKAQYEIEQLNNRLETSLKAGNMAWWEMYLPSGEVKFNENKALMLGYEPEKFKTYQDFTNIVHPDDYQTSMDAMQYHIDGKKTIYECEYRIKNKNGEYIWFYDIGKIVSNEKGNIKVTGIVIKINERKKNELALIEREKELQKLNATKDKFFSIISHDLKNPFNAILGFSQMLLKKHNDYDSEKREKMLESVNSSAKSAYKLLENLLTWSRSQSGTIKHSPEELNLKTVLFETMFNLKGQADKKQIIVVDDISEDDFIFADANMTTTILRNLISNAIKYTNKGGKIIISSEKQENSNFLLVSVKDDGIGIPENEIDNLFRIDKNTSTAGTENESGTGLGLILCKEFVEKNGGKIWVESELEQGSEFKFTMPQTNIS